jgi:tRNASer (uridine44-2'-O)-methyltransferase
MISTTFATFLLLGNHSDELTPWIPVFACLSSPTTKYWVLPCCPFNLTAKYMRRNASVSVFRDYLDYVVEAGGLAGFQVEEDRMRIPSTKRICLVGTPSANQDYDARKQKVLDYVTKQIANFKPREKIERVRNCTKIGVDIIESIVNCVASKCLESSNPVPKEPEGSWNAGGEISLGDLVAHLQVEKIDLSRLKSECGGLQTLLKNNHSIFQVQKGRVKFRVPAGAKPTFDSAKIRRKPCWFHDNHPDGCLLDKDTCTWIHT